MVCGHGGGCFGGQFVELTGSDAFVDAGADFLSDENGIAMNGAQAITEFLEASGYFVEVHRFLASVPLYNVHFYKQSLVMVVLLMMLGLARVGEGTLTLIYRGGKGGLKLGL